MGDNRFTFINAVNDDGQVSICLEMPLPFPGVYNTLSSSGFMNEFNFNIIIKALQKMGR